MALDGLLKTYSDVNQAATNLWGDAYLAAYAAVERRYAGHLR
jgi:hypothetical protein